jgi:outer membrane protein
MSLTLLTALLLAAEPGTLTLDEALRQAVAHQPDLADARFQTEAASAQVTQAHSIQYPQVNANVQLIGATDNGASTAYVAAPDFARVTSSRPTYLVKDDISQAVPLVSSLAGVGAHYDLVDFGYTRGVVGAAQTHLEATSKAEKQTLQDVLLRVSSAYFAGLAAQESLQIAQDNLKRMQVHFSYAEAGVKSGLRPPNELPRAQADVQAGKLAVIRAQNSLHVARAALDTAIGWIPAAPYDLQKPPVDNRLVPEAAESSSRAMTNRFDLAALQANEASTDYQRQAAYTQNYPRLIATGSVNVRGFDSAPNAVNYDLGVVFQVPIFTGFQIQGQVQELDSRLAALHAQEMALRDAINYQLRQSRETLLSAREAISASQAQVDAAKAALDLSDGRYRNGLGNIVEVVDAEAQYDSAQQGLVQSELDAAVSSVQLDYALGELRVP